MQQVNDRTPWMNNFGLSWFLHVLVNIYPAPGYLQGLRFRWLIGNAGSTMAVGFILTPFFTVRK